MPRRLHTAADVRAAARAALGPALVMLVLAGLAGRAAARTEDATLALGARIEATLGVDDRGFASAGGRGRWWSFAAETTGPITVALESHDAAVVLYVEHPSGAMTPRTGGGVFWNVRATLDVERGDTVRFGAFTPVDRDVAITLSATRGAAAPLVDPLGVERCAFHVEAARRARERGAEGEALQHDLERARVLEQTQRYVDAVALLEPTVETAAALGDAAASAHARVLLGAASVRLRRYDVAIDVLADALGDVDAAAPDARLPLLRFGLDALGDALLAVGEAERARAAFEQLLATAREAGVAAAERIALTKIARAHEQLGRLAEADEFHERAVALARELADPAGLVDALGQYGRHLLDARADVDAAERVLREAYGLTVAGAADPLVFGNLGRIEERRGRIDAARELYDAALAGARRTGHRRFEAAALHALATLALRVGEPGRAIEDYRRGLALVPEGEFERRATFEFDLAVAYERVGDDAARERALEEVIRLGRDAGDDRLLARGLTALGALRREQGEPSAARELHVRALELVAGVDRDTELEVYTDLATLELAEGRFTEAAEAAERAVTLAEAAGDEERVLAPLQVLARVHLRRGDLDGAAALVTLAETIFDRPRVRTYDLDPRAGLRSRFAAWAEVSQELVALRLACVPVDDETARTRVIAEGFADAGRWKGRSLLEGIVEGWSGGRSAELARLRRDRRARAAERDACLLRIADGLASGADAAWLADLRTQADAFARDVDALGAAIVEHAPAAAAPDVARALPLEVIRERLLAPGRVLVDYVTTGSSLHAYVITAARTDLVDLGPQAAVDELVGPFVEGIGRQETLASAATVTALGRALYDRLLAPVLTRVDEPVGHLIVVPSTGLVHVPFEALVTSTPGTSFRGAAFVIDRWAVSYGPSAAVLAALAAAPPRASDEDAVLILADPVPGEAAGGESVAASWPRLTGARAETLELARLVLGDAADDRLEALRSTRSGSLETAGLTLHLGGAAEPSCLDRDLSRYALIHCAAHATVDPLDPARSALVLSGPDGELRLRDVLDLSLDADLTVLSACRTAAGPVQRGEGVQSLARAFMAAGARTVVASVWQVGDEATHRVMRGFYEQLLLGGRAPAEALRLAKLAMRTDLRGEVASLAERGGPLGRMRVDAAAHPYYWAGFLHIGAP